MGIKLNSILIQNGVRVIINYHNKYVFNLIHEIINEKFAKVKYADMWLRERYVVENALKLYLTNDDYQEKMNNDKEKGVID